MTPGLAFYQGDSRNIILGLIALAIIALIVYLVATGGIQIGAITPVVGEAYLNPTLTFVDYFGDANKLPPTVDVKAFDANQDSVTITTVDLTKRTSLNLPTIVVPLNRPKFYISVDAPQVDSALWYVIYPPEVNADAPTSIAGYIVYPVDLTRVLGTLKANRQYAYTMNILLAKTYNYTTLQLPVNMSITAGFTPSATNPLAVSIGGTVVAPEDEVMYKGITVYIEVPANVTPRLLTFDGVAISLTKINDTTWKGIVGDIEFKLNETAKSLDLGLDITATGSFTITIKIEGTLPDGTKNILATGSTLIAVS